MSITGIAPRAAFLSLVRYKLLESRTGGKPYDRDRSRQNACMDSLARPRAERTGGPFHARGRRDEAHAATRRYGDYRAAGLGPCERDSARNRPAGMHRSLCSPAGVRARSGPAHRLSRRQRRHPRANWQPGLQPHALRRLSRRRALGRTLPSQRSIAGLDSVHPTQPLTGIPIKNRRVFHEHPYRQPDLQHLRVLDRGQDLPDSQARRARAQVGPPSDSVAACLPPPRPDVLDARGHVRGNSSAVRLSGRLRRPPCRFAGHRCDSGSSSQREGSPSSRVGIQYRGHLGSDRRNNACDGVRRGASHGTRILDPGVLGSRAAGDALHHLRRSHQVLEAASLVDHGGAMRKLKLQMQISVDGFVAGPEGQLDWMTWEMDEKLISFINHLTDTSDTILLGRKMTAGFVKYWEGVIAQPKSPEYEFGKKMVSMLKVVFSKTVTRVEGQNVRVE